MPVTPVSTPYTVGDTLPLLTGTVSADLSGATLEIHIARPDNTVISRTGSVVTPGAANSTWSFQLVGGDLTLAGVYRVEVEVHFAGGGTQTFAFDAEGRINTFTVRDQIG
jgi:hypothetical protein